MRLVMTHPDGLLGCEDEVWWRRVRRPHLHAGTDEGHPLRLVEQTVAKHRERTDGEPKALACYGLLARWYPADAPPQEARWLRFVAGRPVRAVTTQYLAWCCARLAALGKTALLLVWDNASWHISKEGRTWLRAYNHQVKAAGTGVRILACPLPTKSPWLNPSEPKWVQGKRAGVAPNGLLPATVLEARVCASYHCPVEPHLAIPQDPA